VLDIIENTKTSLFTYFPLPFQRGLLTKAFLGLLVPTIANDFADHLLFANQYENGAQKLGIFCKKLVNWPKNRRLNPKIGVAENKYLVKLLD
jgi:hypothetical protein